MRRQIVLGILFAAGVLTMTVNALQQPPGRPRGSPRRAWSRSTSSRTTCYMMRGGGGNSAVFITSDRRRGRRYQEPGLGSAAPRQDQDRHRQAGDDDHQHAYARRSRERQRRVPGDRGSRDAREHREEHAGDASAVWHHAGVLVSSGQYFQGEQRPRPAEADVHRQDDDRQGRRSNRAPLLRPRPHQRRRVGGVSGAARHARRRHLLRQEHPAPRRQSTAAAASRSARRWPRPRSR